MTTEHITIPTVSNYQLKKYYDATRKQLKEKVQNLIANKDTLNPKNHLDEKILLLESTVSDQLISITRLLLHHGAKVNVQRPDGMTPLRNTIANNAISTMKILIQKGAHPSFDMQLIHRILTAPEWSEALFMKRMDMLKIVFNAQADPDGLNHEGQTPLMHLVDLNKKYTTMPLAYRNFFTRYLLYCGANTKIINKEKMTAASIARHNKLLDIAHIIEKAHNPLVKEMSNYLFKVLNVPDNKRLFPRPDMPFEICQLISQVLYAQT